MINIQVYISELHFHVFACYKIAHAAYDNSGSVLFIFAITAAGVVPCSGPKKSPRISTKVQIIFLFCPLRSARVFCEIRQ